MPLSLDAKLELKELELTSLFETIRAINSNASERDLYKIYKFIIRSNQNIARLALYVLDEEWNCKVFFGTKQEYSRIPLDSKILAITEVTQLDHTIRYFEEFDRVIPVKHKSNVLAYVFISSLQSVEDEEGLELDFIDALSNIIIVAIENKKLARQEQKQIEYRKQLEIAGEVQTMLFPNKLPYEKQLKLEASYHPHHTIGGDYYDFVPISENKFMICIADVSGKGVPAAILMSNFQAALRILTQQEMSLSKIVHVLNTLIMENSNGQNFITAFFAQYDREKKELEYINAGHNPPFLFQDGKTQRLEKGTTILGGFDELPFIEDAKLSLEPNFLIFCFTDGFTETYNEAGEEFGEAYLQEFLEENITLDQKELHRKLIQLLNTFKGDNAFIDDITLLSCKVMA